MIVKKVNLSRAALIGCLMLGTVDWLGEEGRGAQADERRVTVMPYVIPLGFDGTSTVEGTEGDLEFGIDDYAETVEWGGYLRAEAWNDTGWAFVFDGGMTWLDKEFRQAGKRAGDATFRWGRFDLMVARRVVDKKVGKRAREQFAVDLFGGARTQYLRQELAPDSGGEVAGNATWVEPVIGGRLRRQISNVTTLLVEGDASGFGIGNASDLTWNLRAGADIELSDGLALRLMYNLTGIDYTKGGGSTKFGLDGVAQGPMLGVIFGF